MSIRFVSPEILVLLLALPLLWALFVFFNQQHRKKIGKYIDGRLMAPLIESLSVRKRKIKLFLRLFAAGFFILALARPQAGEKKIDIKSEGIEFVILFDVSRSMLAEDVRPSRLEFAKKEVSRFLSLVSGHKVGILAFAGAAFLVSPLTTDMPALKMLVQSLNSDAVSTQGTEYKKALAEAGQAFDRGGVQKSKDVHVTKAVVVVSDGEDNEAGAIEAAQALAKKGIKIFVLGFGTKRGGPIPLKNADGDLVGYFKDNQERLIHTKAQTKLLKEIARVGEGSFYSVNYGSRSIEQLVSDLDRLEKTELESTVAIDYGELFQIFLMLGLLCAFLDLSMSERKSLLKFWRGRFEKTV